MANNEWELDYSVLIFDIPQRGRRGYNGTTDSRPLDRLRIETAEIAFGQRRVGVEEGAVQRAYLKRSRLQNFFDHSRLLPCTSSLIRKNQRHNPRRHNDQRQTQGRSHTITRKQIVQAQSRWR
ncbi:hypothetical protein KCV03_g114, partial [Aureobasidium melanogenum]